MLPPPPPCAICGRRESRRRLDRAVPRLQWLRALRLEVLEARMLRRDRRLVRPRSQSTPGLSVPLVPCKRELLLGGESHKTARDRKIAPPGDRRLDLERSGRRVHLPEVLPVLDRRAPSNCKPRCPSLAQTCLSPFLLSLERL